MNSGDRKMKELGGAEQTPANTQFAFFDSNIHGGRHLASLNGPPAGGRQSQVQQILNTAAARPFKPSSFTSLLMANDEDDEDPLDAAVKSQGEQVNQILTLHTDILKRALGGMLEKQQRAIQRAANEQTVQKLKQKETEHTDLGNKAEHYRKEAERLQAKADHLEQTNASLRTWLQGTYGACIPAREDTGLSDGMVGSVRIECKACGQRRAMVMMWPCRHVCVCSRCEVATRTCPICRTLKRMGIEVVFPLG